MTAKTTKEVDSQLQKLRRPDGRNGGSSLRPLAVEISCLSRADGSAKFSSGSSQVLAAIYGPAAPRIPSRERMEEAIIGVVFKFGTKSAFVTDNTSNTHPGYGANERELERFIGDTLMHCIAVDQYPRTVIEVVIQVIKADGSLVSTALNAVILALMDAGIELKSLPITTTCLVPKNDNSYEVRFDPTSEEETIDGSSIVILVIDSVEEGIIASMTFGSFRLDSFLFCIEGASKVSKAIIAFIRIAIEQKTVREARTLWLT
mmetsp:Transcript_9685/g.11211  ORF Transcript_9685/g.11211 Transcript_9685/m.11211 type:complete len:261 (+) Transcript_9685:38-820(+)